jgi:glycosyltransferase involved in cell wall biosynthesis
MNILLIAYEFPYPPNHGGKVDIWNRIRAFKECGYKVFLITWYGIIRGETLSTKSISVVKSSVNGLMMLPIRRDITRLISLCSYPSLVAARIVKAKMLKEILKQVRVFEPDCVLVDGLYAGELGLKLSMLLNIPSGVRLHNLEFEYMLGQYALSRSWKDKIAIRLALLHLKSFEDLVIQNADIYFDISVEDLDRRLRMGYSHGYWLPPVIPKKRFSVDTAYKKEYDICFLGNLNAPNNVDGVLWFVNEVLPLILQEVPEVKVLIMGSKPSEEIRALSKIENINVLANPDEPENYIKKSNILINPVRFSSGVNLKSIEMLSMPNPIISTTFGLRGLPEEVKELFFIADESIKFADYIIRILNKELLFSVDRRSEFRRLFDYERVKVIERLLCSQ